MLLREGLKRCHEREGANTSFRAIILAMNNHFRLNGKDGYALNTVDALGKSLSRIYNGNNVTNDRLKSDVWDYLVRENYIFSTDFPDDANVIEINLANFFKQTEKPKAEQDAVGFRYFGYKAAIRDPDKYIVKFLVTFFPSDLGNSILRISEKHFNRAHRPNNSPVMTELWSGYAFARRRCIFAVVREDLYGTPRAYTLHSPQNREGLAVQILGDSVEAVENWGNMSSNSSKIVLDIIPDNVSIEDAEEECDIISKRVASIQVPHVVKHIFGE